MITRDQLEGMTDIRIQPELIKEKGLHKGKSYGKRNGIQLQEGAREYNG